MLGNRYDLFGNGQVGYSIIIAGGNRLVYSGLNKPTQATFNAALMSLDIYPVAPVVNIDLFSGSQIVKDLNECFVSTDSLPINYSIESVSNSDLVNASLSGTILTVTAAQAIGTANVKIKAMVDSSYAFSEFIVKVKDPAVTELINADFELFPPVGWTNNGWSKGTTGSNGACAKVSYHPAGTRTLTSPVVTLPADQTATLSFDWKNNDITKIVGHDSTFCEITKDNGTTWTKLALLSAPSYQTSFSHVNKTLEGYKGQAIQLRWRYKSDAANQAFGAGLDEVQLYFTGVSIDAENCAAACELMQNYPNPFNPESTIDFTISKDAAVNLSIYNAKGEIVKTMVNSTVPAGYHSVKFNAAGLNSGVYFYKLTTPANSLMKKMLLVK